MGRLLMKVSSSMREKTLGMTVESQPRDGPGFSSLFFMARREHATKPGQGQAERRSFRKKRAARQLQVKCTLSFRNINVFQFRIALHRGHAKVAAKSALLEAAKGGFQMDAAMGVDAEDTAFHTAGDPQGALEIIRPEGTAQAVRRGVDFRQHLFLAVKGTNAGDGAEDFLAPDAIRSLTAEHHRRIQIITLPRGAVAAAEDFVARRFGRLQKTFHNLALFRRNQRA